MLAAPWAFRFLGAGRFDVGPSLAARLVVNLCAAGVCSCGPGVGMRENGAASFFALFPSQPLDLRQRARNVFLAHIYFRPIRQVEAQVGFKDR